MKFLDELGILAYRRNMELKNEITSFVDQNEKLNFIKNSFGPDDLESMIIELYRKQLISLDDIFTYFGIEQKEFLNKIATRLKFGYLDLDEIDVNYNICEKIQHSVLEQYGFLPFKEDEVNLHVTYKNPFDLEAQDKIQYLFNRKLIKNYVSDPQQIERYLNKIQLNENIREVIVEIRKELNSEAALTGRDDSSGILKLIEIILRTCIVNRASDIHIEPAEVNCIVRGRIDGVLTEVFVFDKDIYPPMVSRMKLLSGMDIAEKRKPQDGRFSARILEKEYDFRISTLPIMNGESIVLRILDKSKILISLDNLGMHPVNLNRFQTSMHSPYGIILVTGPTGSGKTTTLYAALNDIKSIESKIITVEDPVEYQLHLVQQVHVNEKAGLTFAGALRSILRQDPDVIMIGEIRDTETLRIAIQAALTGHLVFSTLHTNDAVSAITRIADMGIEPYMISGALIAIEAQRLVRKLCPNCKQKTKIPDSLFSKYSHYLENEEIDFCKPVGCPKCSQTGYFGREMVSEILLVSDKISSMIARGASKDELRKQAYEEGFIDMFHDGIIRAAKGITSLDEVLSVAKEYSN